MVYAYDDANECRASFVYAEDAAILISALGDGSTIRDNSRGRGRVLWSEGHEEQPAAESYDFVAETVNRRNAGG